MHCHDCESTQFFDSFAIALFYGEFTPVSFIPDAGPDIFEDLLS
jgi:hypothetical protein